jgi:hypothetical protein
MRTLTALTLTALFAFGAACSSNTEEGPIVFGHPTGGATGSGANGQGSGSTANPGTGGAPVNIGGLTGSGATNTAGGIEGCTGVSQATTPLPPVLEFLIDTSGSMDDKPKNATGTKWEVTRDALVQAFTNMQDGTGTGLIFYPNQQGQQGNCIRKQQAVPLNLLDMPVRTSLLTALQNKNPQGATPTHDAYVYALDTLQSSTLTGNKYIVLVTDGAPTYALGCVGNGRDAVDNTPLIQEAASAASARGIKTFVIGSPGSEVSREALSAIASQGGTAPPGCSDTGPTYCHFDMTTVTDLSVALNDALAQITGRVISCVYKIPPPMNNMEIDYTKVNVNFTSSAGVVTPIGSDPNATSCEHGWQYTADKSQIQLCPDTCDLVKNDPDAKIDIVLGCSMRPL